MFKKITDEEKKQIVKKNWPIYKKEKMKLLTEKEKLLFIENENLYMNDLNSPLKQHFSSVTGYTDDVYKKLKDISLGNKEKLILFCFDENSNLIYSEVIMTGWFNKIDINYKLLCEKLLSSNRNAYYMIAHNHPLHTGACFSGPDLDVAFACARLGELLNIHFIDSLVTTECDVASLAVEEKTSENKILNYHISDILTDRILTLTNKPLYTYLMALKNNRNRTIQDKASLHKVTDMDVKNLMVLIDTILAKYENRNEIIEKLENNLNSWK